MSFLSYPRYKDSGVEWLGEVPEHWASKRIKHVVAERAGIQMGPFGGMLLNLENEDTGFKVYGQENTISGDFTRGSRWITSERFEALSAYELCPGDLVLTRKGSLGNARLIRELPQTGVIDSDTIRLRPRESLIHREFFARMVHDTPYIFAQIAVSKRGAILSGVNTEVISNLVIVLPPLAEQAGIESFLDGELEKIDALVAEQRRLMELLKEQRQAVISHAVTKGLDPDAPMKPSGFEWLGEVPAHWRVLRIKRIVDTIEQGWSPQCENYPAEGNDEWGVLKVGCVNGGVFRPTENKLLPDGLQPLPELGVRTGDVLISRANTRELVGSAIAIEQDYPRLMLCDKLYRLRLMAEQCLPEFLAFYLGSRPARSQIELGATGASASMVNIDQATILDMTLSLPPFSVQQEIVEYLVTEAMAASRLTAEVERAIALLQERRTALISAAVTGKIDVRGLAEQVA